MFYGSIPSEVQSMIAKIVKGWDCDNIYVGCSGNFTIERCLKDVTKAKMHSNDVTVYSCLLGRYLTGQSLNAKMKPDYDGVMRFVEKYLDDGAGTMAVVLLLSRMGVYLGSKPNAYYTKIINEYVKQFDDLWKKTKEKLEKIEPFVETLYEGDVCEWIDDIPLEEGVICYPPFFSGDYEKMFRVIDEIFDWDPPTFEFINKDRIDVLFEKMTKHKYFIFGTNDYLTKYEEYLIGKAQTTNRGMPLYIYSNTDKSFYVGPRQATENLYIKRLSTGEEVGDHIELKILSNTAFQTLRSEYMNINIRPGQATLAIGVLVDDKLIGVYAFSASPTLSNWDAHIDTPTMYLLSDFPVEPTDYDRLAKLVLYAALSKESKMIAERIMRKRVRSLVTTAFSKNPSSMKYRGLFKVLNRKENTKEVKSDNPSNAYYNQKYTINYGAKMGEWSLQEGLELWKKNHGQRTGKKIKE